MFVSLSPETKRILKATLVAILMAGCMVLAEEVISDPKTTCELLTDPWLRWLAGCDGWLPPIFN
jgi:hypothetical protein